jgi:cytochrome o ubiquinol oxidase subunit 3
MATNIAAGADTRLWNAEADEHDPISARTFGFWLYLLSDALIFAGLFASYAVLDNSFNAAGGPIAAQIVHPLEGLIQTFAVLGSVLSYSLATVAMKKGSRTGVIHGILGAIVLSGVFLGIGAHDLLGLIAQGDGPDRSGFLSIFFTLIVSHGLHMVFGILWMLVMLVQVARTGFNQDVVGRLLNLRLFWQFQASVWVCVYVYVYLLGGYN